MATLKSQNRILKSRGLFPRTAAFHPEQELAQPSGLLGIDGRDASHALTSSDSGVSGGDLLLLEYGRSANGPLVEGHHWLVERAHHHVLEKNPTTRSVSSPALRKPCGTLVAAGRPRARLKLSDLALTGTPAGPRRRAGGRAHGENGTLRYTRLGSGNLQPQRGPRYRK